MQSAPGIGRVDPLEKLAEVSPVGFESAKLSTVLGILSSDGEMEGANGYIKEQGK